MHVTHKRFGLPPVGRYNELKQLHAAGKPIRDPIALQAILSQAYDITYGLYDHNSEKAHPFATSLLHEGERLDYRSPLQLRLKEYRSRQVKDITGLNFDEFLNRPRDEVETILNECAVQNNADIVANEAAAAAAALAVATGQGKNK